MLLEKLKQIKKYFSFFYFNVYKMGNAPSGQNTGNGYGQAPNNVSSNQNTGQIVDSQKTQSAQINTTSVMKKIDDPTTITKNNNDVLKGGVGTVINSYANDVPVTGTKPSSCPCGQQLLEGLCYNCPEGHIVSAPGICSIKSQTIIKQGFEDLEGFESVAFNDFIKANPTLSFVLFIIIFFIIAFLVFFARSASLASLS
jgi:hypothetical protein